MVIHFWPETRTTKWAVGFIVLMPVLFFLGFWVVGALYPGVTAGNSIKEDLLVRPLLAVPMLLGMLSGLVAFVLSTIALARKHERSVTAVLVWVVGFGLVVMLAGEFLSKH